MPDAEDAPFSYPGLERIFHERGRLAICTCLIAHPDGLSFTELANACDLTDGNLNRHMHALADIGIVTTEKQRGSGRPLTVYRITKSGRAALSRLRRRARIRRARRARAFASTRRRTGSWLRRDAPSTSRSLWTAIAVGPKSAGCRSPSATSKASRRCGKRCSRPAPRASSVVTAYAFSEENWNRPTGRSRYPHEPLRYRRRAANCARSR